MPSIERKTSSQLLSWRVLAMKLSCTNGETSRFAQLLNQLMMPDGESADAVGR
jgi:hypothetical protein